MELNMKDFFSQFSMLILFILFSCNNHVAIDKEADKKHILELHEKQRDFHFKKMHLDLVAQMSDSFISVNRGKLSFPTKNEMEERFDNYFNTVEFEKWDDVTEPFIILSEDGSLANVFVDKEVVITYTKDNHTMKETTRFAWIAVYMKLDDEWKLHAMASTNGHPVIEKIHNLD